MKTFSGTIDEAMKVIEMLESQEESSPAKEPKKTPVKPSVNDERLRKVKSLVLGRVQSRPFISETKSHILLPKEIIRQGSKAVMSAIIDQYMCNHEFCLIKVSKELGVSTRTVRHYIYGTHPRKN